MKTTLKIQNLKCGGCAHTIKTKLEALNDIENVTVNTDTDEVSFNHLESLELDQVTSLLSKLGYPIQGESNPIAKKAKSFVSCAVGRMNS